ncbi:MAG TPA: hypothetical protein PKA64_21940, partial [Myxococcota bacterium]|nr:hypothetical protein [Myxococcota bacterium]
IDGKTETAWMLPGESAMRGEWIEIDVPRGDIDKIAVFPGWGKNEESFTDYGRPKTLRVDIFSTNDDNVTAQVGTANVTVADKAELQVLDLPDPVWLAPSPFGDVVLASSGYGNALVILDYAPASPQPLTARGAPAWVGARPQLPSAVVVITRGPLTGLALTSENGGVRRTWMRGGGVVEDLGLTPFGAGLENLAGAIGVQP